jgi:hypothetical protein
MYRDDFTVTPDLNAVQGDVPFIKRDKVPEGLKPVKGNLIRLGEVTGHHHIVDAPATDYQLYADDRGAILAMELFSTVSIRHQEHGTVTLPAGVYVIPEQVEYDGAEERRVLD